MGSSRRFASATSADARLADLRDRSRCARDLGVGDGLDRVDREHVGRQLVDLREDGVERGRAAEQHARVEGADALGAEADLLGRLLRADEQASCTAPGELPERLQQERALAHAGLAAEQRDTAGDEPAAEDAVELADAGRPARRGGRGHRVDRHRHRHRTHARGGEGRSTPGAGGRRLDEGAPGATLGATPEPAGCQCPALAATVDRPGLHAAHDRTWV